MKKKLTAAVQYLLIYLMLIMHGAVVWAIKYADSFLALLAVMVVCVVVYSVFNLRFSLSYILMFALLAVLFCLSGIFSGDSIWHGFSFKTLLQIYLNFIVSYGIIKIDTEYCLTRFIRLVLFFTVISLVGFAFCNLGGLSLLKRILPVYRYERSTRIYYGKYLFSILWGEFEPNAYQKNIGIYYEPGVHEIVLNCALFVLLFLKKYLRFSRKAYFCILFILVAAVITTKSTTGYIGLVLILVTEALFHRKSITGLMIFVLLAVLAFGVLVDYVLRGADSIVAVHLIQKLQDVSFDGTVRSSGSARLVPIRIAMLALKKNPLFGLNTTKVEYLTFQFFGAAGGTGNALFGMISTKGLLAVALLMYMLFVPMLGNKAVSPFVFFTFFLMVINVSCAQAQVAYPGFVLVALFYGTINPRYLQGKKKDKDKCESTVPETLPEISSPV